MIAAAMVFSAILALLVTAATHALDKTAQLWRLPRRGLWALALLTSWVLPLAMITHTHQAVASRMTLDDPAIARVSTLGDEVIAIHRVMPQVLAPRWPARPELDEALALIWTFASCGLLLLWGASGLRIYRRAKTWPVIELDGVFVSVTDAFGPAALGYLRPRIVMPSTVLDQPPAIRMIALKHEQAHIRAGDPLLLLMALVLVVLAPWNVALWWQLHRLRFAIEVDCDARVLKEGVSPSAYGETLLAISQQSIAAPLGIVTLIDPTSQLERRIRLMFSKSPHHSLAATAAFLVLAISLGACAAQLDPPTVGSAAPLLKLPPDSESEAAKLTQRFSPIVEERFPQLMHQAVKGTPVVYLLFRNDGRVEQAICETVGGKPGEEVTSTVEAYAQRFRIPVAEVAYAGIQGITVPATGQWIVIAFTERKDPTQPFVSQVVDMPNTRSIDRALTERYFPDALKAAIPKKVRRWVLLDSDGHVLRTGEESSSTPELTHILEARYPGIETQYITATAVPGDHSKWLVDPSGVPLQIFCVWLKKGSSLPTSS